MARDNVWSHKLQEWKKEMSKACKKPQEGDMVVVQDNLYKRIKLPKDHQYAGHMRWYRLTALEIASLYSQQEFQQGAESFMGTFINGRSCTKRNSIDD